MPERLRIAVVLLGRRGGTLKYGQLMAAAMSKRHQVRCILSSDQYDRYDFPENVETVYVPTGRSKLGMLANSLYPPRHWKVVWAVRSFKPDVVWSPAAHAWDLILYPWLMKFPIVQTIHDVSPHLGERSRYYEALREFECAASTRLVVLSEAARSQVHPSVSRDRVHVVPPCPFPLGRGFERGGFAPPPGNRQILFSGRILPYKGVGQLLQAFAAAVSAVPDAKLAIVGAGDMSPYRELVESTPNVTVDNSFVSEESLTQYYADSDFVVLPYVDASQSGVIPLALSNGRAVIATDVGGLAEQFSPDQHGLLVPPDDVPRLAEAIQTLLSDPQRVRTMGRLGWEEYTHGRFSLDSLAQSLEGYLRSAAGAFDRKAVSRAGSYWRFLRTFVLGHRYDKTEAPHADEKPRSME